MSKLEKYIQEKLLDLYPNINFIFNGVKDINAELDIFIPDLMLAFELNGIFHYEPIYGQDKLEKIQSNDNRRFQACLEKGIELVIMDVSQLKYFKENNAKPYLDIIIKIINSKLNDPAPIRTEITKT